MTTCFPYFFFCSVLCWFEEVSSLSKVIIKINYIGESRKKIGKSSDDYFILVIVEKRFYFLFSNLPFRKKNDDTAAILRNHLWHATVYFFKSKEKKEKFHNIKKDSCQSMFLEPITSLFYARM